MRHRNVGPLVLAVLGIAIMLIGLGLHWWRPDEHSIEWIPELVGAVIGFVGFYAMDPDGAIKGGGFIVDAGTKIIAVIRTGNRASDPVVTVTKEAEPHNPVQFVDGPDDGAL